MELELRCRRKFYEIAADPQPDWSFEHLLMELDSIKQEQMHSNSEFSAHFTKTPPREFKAPKENGRSARGFLMYISDDDDSITVSSSDDDEAGSDDSENEEHHGIQLRMARVDLAECALIELNHEYLQNTTEEVRSKISLVEAELIDEYEKFSSSIDKIDRHREMQQGVEKKIDLHYKRTVAEALDNHLTSIQRDLEQKSQLEERRIRDDAAREEAKRRERALLEEKMLQERIKAEEEARLKAEMAEKARKEAIEAEKRAAAEEARLAAETLRDANPPETKVLGVDLKNQSAARNVIRASENALESEKRRRQVFNDICANNPALMATGNPAYRQMGRTIGRAIRQVSSTEENIRTKAEELFKAINSPGCPQSLGIELFADKILNGSRGSSNLFALCRVIVLVTSKVPNAMDVFLAKLNGVCIYTVPKHIRYIKEEFESKDSYLRAIGFGEDDDGRMETAEKYVERLHFYMGLYGALVQTEVRGFRNLHGLREGWAWLARFLNHMPANAFTLAALRSFLEMAGYGLYTRYRNQFEKLLTVISRDFLKAMEASSGGPKSDSISNDTAKLRHVLQSYKKKPEESEIQKDIESSRIYD